MVWGMGLTVDEVSTFPSLLSVWSLPAFSFLAVEASSYLVMWCQPSPGWRTLLRGQTVGEESSTRGNPPKPLSDIGIFRLHKRWSFESLCLPPQMCFPHFYKDNAEGVSCVLPLRGFYRWKVLWFKAHWSDLTDLSPGLRRSFLCFSTSVRSCPLAGHTHLGTDYLYICYVWGPDWLTTFHLPSSPQK